MTTAARPYRRPGSPVTAGITLDVHTDVVWIVRAGGDPHGPPDRFYARAFASAMDAERYADDLKMYRVSPYVERVAIMRLNEVPEMSKVYRIEMKRDDSKPSIVRYTDRYGRDYFAPSDSPPRVDWEYPWDRDPILTVHDTNRVRALRIAAEEMADYIENVPKEDD